MSQNELDMLMKYRRKEILAQKIHQQLDDRQMVFPAIENVDGLNLSTIWNTQLPAIDNYSTFFGDATTNNVESTSLQSTDHRSIDPSCHSSTRTSASLSCHSSSCTSASLSRHSSTRIFSSPSHDSQSPLTPVLSPSTSRCDLQANDSVFTIESDNENNGSRFTIREQTVNETKFDPTLYYRDDPERPIVAKDEISLDPKQVCDWLFNLNKWTTYLNSSPPQKVSDNVTFLIDGSKIKHINDVQCDGMGTWQNLGSRDKTVETDEGYCQVKVTYYSLKVAKEFKKQIAYERRSDFKMPNRILLHYYFSGEPIDLTHIVHNTPKYTKTFRSTLNVLQESPGVPLKAIRHQIIESAGGIQKIASTDQLPKNAMQVYYHKNKHNESVIDGLQAAINNAKSSNSIIRKIVCFPELCVLLMTDQQKIDIKRFCTAEEFSITGVDTTFNIGKFLVTILTYRHLFLEHKETGKPPVLLGPCFIHQSKSFESYNEMANGLFQNEVRDLKAIGTDGDKTLWDAFAKVFPDSLHLFCEIHIKDNIIKKLSDFAIEKQDQTEILNRLFGSTIGEIEINGLVQTTSSEEFDRLFTDLSDYLRKIKNGFSFHDYFVKNKLLIFKDHLRSDYRTKAGLGLPPSPYYQNANESMNALLKIDLKKSLNFYEFIEFYQIKCQQEQEKIELSLSGYGDWKIKDKYTKLFSDKFNVLSSNQKTRIVSKFNNITIQDANQSAGVEYFQIPGVPQEISSLIFKKAIEINEKKLLSPFPGKPDSYLTPSYSNPAVCHSVVVKKSGSISCDSKCPQFATYNFCSHVLALAIKLDVVPKFLEYFSKKKSKQANLEKLSTADFPNDRGNKNTQRTQIRLGSRKK